jgi:site-specific recombinase XerD
MQVLEIRMRIHFYLIKNIKGSKFPIKIYLNRNGQRKALNTGFYIEEKYWNKNKERAKANYPNAIQLNSALDKIEQEIEKKHFEIITIKPNVSNDFLFAELQKTLVPNEKNFITIFEEFINSKKHTTSESFVKKLITLKNRLVEFSEQTNTNLTFENLNLLFSEKFINYLIEVENYANNSIEKLLSLLKTFIRWANMREYSNISNLDFLKYKKNETDTFALTLDELRRISKLKISDSDYMKRSRDAFVVACMSGVRFSDVKQISKTQVKDGILELRQQKTKAIAEIPINSEITNILNSYQEDKPFAELTNQVVNRYLKEIAKESGIDEPITKSKISGAKVITTTKPKYEFVSFHASRRTFVTISLHLNINAEYVRQVSGHKSLNEFQKYIRMNKKQIIEEYNKVSFLN